MLPAYVGPGACAQANALWIPSILLHHYHTIHLHKCQHNNIHLHKCQYNNSQQTFVNTMICRRFRDILAYFLQS